MYVSNRQFNNKKVVDISSETNRLDLSTISPMLRLDPNNKQTFGECFAHFLAHQDATTLDTLVIGFWSDDYDLSDTSGLSTMLATLIDNNDKLPALKALFLGNIGQEESEISWIELVCFSPIISALAIENFRARGNGEFLNAPINNTGLKKLSFETGGMSADTIKNILLSDLPNLEHLELWIGDSEYGDTDFDTLKPLLESEQFPKLRYLGIKNCACADEVAITLADNAPILKTVTQLDLSLGSLSDKGAKALTESANIATLDKLDLHHHYIVDEAILAKLTAGSTEVDISDQQEADVYEYDDEVEISRYIFVSE